MPLMQCRFAVCHSSRLSDAFSVIAMGEDWRVDQSGAAVQ